MASKLFSRKQQEADFAVQAGGYDAIPLSYTLSKETTQELVGLIERYCPDCPIIAIKQRDKKLVFKPAEIVLDSKPPKMLLEAIKRVHIRLLQKEKSKFPMSA